MSLRPVGNIYLRSDAMGDDEMTERAEEVSSEEQRHDDQDVDMGQAAAAEVQTEGVPPTVTFRRDPNLNRGEARQKLLKEINQSHEGGQFYVDIVPAMYAKGETTLYQLCEKEIDVDAFSGPGGIPYDSNSEDVTSALDFAQRIRPEIVTGYESKPADFEITGRRDISSHLEKGRTYLSTHFSPRVSYGSVVTFYFLRTELAACEGQQL